jgi:hyperosmotically inducible periplasmic protein
MKGNNMQTVLGYITYKNLGRLGVIALLGAAFGLAGCKTSSPDRTKGQVKSDKEVAKEVDKTLAEDPTFKYTDVKPVVYNGTVQLVGFVETPEQRLRATERAAHSKGAKQIINQIMLKPMPTGGATIRDPLGHDMGHLLVDTNAPVQQMRNLPANEQNQQQPKPDNTEGNSPK